MRQLKNELERRVQDQEEELDEQAGTIQQLEQVRASPWKFILFLHTLAYFRSRMAHSVKFTTASDSDTC